MTYIRRLQDVAASTLLRKKTIVAVALIFALSLLAPSAMADDLAALRQLVHRNNTFALELYSKLRNQRGNLFFSPYSISSALAMTYAGARGTTAAEMAKALHFASGAEKTSAEFARLNTNLDAIQKRGNVKLLVANSLWPQKDYPFLPSYMSLLHKYYGPSTMPVDYLNAPEEARSSINAWIEDKTQGKIQGLISAPLPSTTKLLLVNAIYFKGRWGKPFDPQRTLMADFTHQDGSKRKVFMMRQQGRMGFNEIGDAKILELPYVGGQLSMILILPDNPSQFSGLEACLTSENLDSWLAGITQQHVEVELPRFKVQWGTFDLMPPLQDLGMRKAFGRQADFSRMTGGKNFYIQRVLHKAIVEVNEEGTEAAAATAAVTTLGARPRIRTFKADHSFLFAIRDNSTGTILFIGRMLNPPAIQT